MATKTTTPSDRLIAFRVRGGGNPKTSAQLLAALAASHVGYNLAYALHYNGFVGQARSESAAHDLEVERADDQVRTVAALLPFPVELEADMGGNYSGNSALTIDLGSRGGDDDPHDRAGVDPHQARATWWIETDGGATFEDSRLPANTDPVLVSEWITFRARSLGCPAAQAATLNA